MAGGGGGAVMNYDFGQKRHWRRWVWNRVVERLQVPPREARCIYLPGASDEDMPVAASRGFMRENMIAVERDVATRKSLRSRGVLTVDADFFRAVDVLSTTGAKDFDRVDVVFADLCHGLEGNVLRALYRWLNYPTLRTCVFAFNLQHGREQRSGGLLELFADEDWACNKPGGKPHRGRVLLHSVFSVCANGDDDPPLVGTQASDLVERRYRWMLGSAKPTFSWYRSTSGQTFDTVVLVNPMHRAPPVQVDLDSLMATSGLASKRDFIRARRSAAAVLAHRTRRLGA